jgi:hypothetical protein
MKTHYRAIILATLCLFLQACSYSVEFVLVNESDTTIEVEYQADMRSYGHGTDSVPEAFIPRSLTFGAWDSAYKRGDWKPLANAEYRVDLTTGNFKLKIPPRTALRLAEVGDLVLFQDGYKNFELKSLRVHGLYGDLAFEGVQLFRQFNEKKEFSYFISYKK